MLKLIIKQKKKINTLEKELEDLKELIKSDLYKKLIKEADNSAKIKALQDKNKKLRKINNKLRGEKDGN